MVEVKDLVIWIAMESFYIFMIMVEMETFIIKDYETMQ